MGEAGEGQNITHQQKKMGEAALREFRDRFQIDLTDEQLQEMPFIRFADDSPEMRYLHARAQALGGYLPLRRRKSDPLSVPPLSAFEAQLQGHGGTRDLDHHGVRARAQHAAARQDHRQARGADRAGRSRTFGMEGMFRQFGIFSQVGQLYRPRTPTSSCTTRRTRPARCSRKASMRPAPCRPGSPLRRRIPRRTRQ